MRFSWKFDFCLNVFMGRTFKRLLLFWGALGFIVCSGVFFNGCSIIPTCTVVCLDAKIKQGQEAYLNEDYALSRQIFSQLTLREGHVQLQAAGLYGNACLDMILADNAPDFWMAVEQLLLLQSQRPCRISNCGNQDTTGRETICNPWSRLHPGMLEKALAHGKTLLESERSDMLKTFNALSAKQEVLIKERLNMQKKVDSLGLKITALKKQNREQQARITDLLYQITVLEKIDKERQEQRANP
ncbi:MAG: hypothetical protein CSA25_00780 [Desulfobacter postgatei]|uniref:Uncharacterized protein n=1 Tax=Desulfobacter postgatei TaxID=2293 RepID=A0A2G6MUN3_9BACT|nr:MAG: hypothetical protein CSA25_00780 [Desulfobacter postgatei]